MKNIFRLFIFLLAGASLSSTAFSEEPSTQRISIKNSGDLSGAHVRITVFRDPSGDQLDEMMKKLSDKDVSGISKTNNNPVAQRYILGPQSVKSYPSKPSSTEIEVGEGDSVYVCSDKGSEAQVSVAGSNSSENKPLVLGGKSGGNTCVALDKDSIAEAAKTGEWPAPKPFTVTTVKCADGAVYFCNLVTGAVSVIGPGQKSNTASTDVYGNNSGSKENANPGAGLGSGSYVQQVVGGDSDISDEVTKELWTSDGLEEYAQRVDGYTVQYGQTITVIDEFGQVVAEFVLDEATGQYVLVSGSGG